MTDDITNDILVDRSGRVMTITFNRPRQKNALTHAMYATLADSLEEAGKDDTVRALLFTGAGDAFTAGLLHCWDLPPAHRVRFAAGCGALVCSGAGGIDPQPSAQEVEAFIAEA